MNVNRKKVTESATGENSLLSMLKLLEMGNQEIQQGLYRDAEQVFAELDEPDDHT
jgi:hypothetical protein